jgi:hypothetical protein
VPSSPTTIRGPGACPAIHASTAANPAASLPTVNAAIGTPDGATISKVWLSR